MPSSLLYIFIPHTLSGKLSNTIVLISLSLSLSLINTQSFNINIQNYIKKHFLKKYLPFHLSSFLFQILLCDIHTMYCNFSASYLYFIFFIFFRTPPFAWRGNTWGWWVALGTWWYGPWGREGTRLKADRTTASPVSCTYNVSDYIVSCTYNVSDKSVVRLIYITC